MYLLARTAIAYRKQITRADAADALWPDDFYDATRLRLRQELARLRRTLGSGRDLVKVNAEWIQVDTSDLVTDIDEFKDACRRAQSEPEQRHEHLRKAVELGSEPFLEGADEDWILLERSSLQDLLYASYVGLAEELAARSEFEESLATSRLAIELRPTQEPARLVAVRTLQHLGRSQEAATCLEELERNARATGLGPSRKVSELRNSAPSASTPAVDILRFRIPQPVDPIFGRESELTETVQRLQPRPRERRLLTLLGPGGIGKTRLLQEAAQRLSTDYAGRAAYVDLSSVEDIQLVPLAILGELKADTGPSADPMKQLLGLLPKVPILLALDGLEQLGSSMGEWIRHLLESCPELRIVATSRTALNIPGEQRLTLGPLFVPGDHDSWEAASRTPAVRLFLDTASQHNVQLNAGQGEYDRILSIIRRLEGIPLSIQLAASRLRMLDLEQLDTLLERGLDVLENRRINAPARHQSIRRAIESSFSSLPSDIQRALASLSIFRGGWTLDSAKEVCGLEEPIQAMEVLLDASMAYVAHEGPRMRFAMLETIRTFARDSLGVQEMLTLQRRHADWVYSMAEKAYVEYVTQDDLKFFDILELEQDNVREALRFALDNDPDLAVKFGASLGFFWRYRSNGFEGRRFYQELFERHGDREADTLLARAAFGRAIIGVMFSEDDDARHREYEAICLKVGLPAEAAKMKVFQAINAQNAQLYDESAARFKEAAALLGEDPSPCDLAILQTWQAFCFYHQGLCEAAIPLLNSAVAAFDEAREVFHVTRSRCWLAMTALDLESFDVAKDALDGLMERVVRANFLPMVPIIHSAEGRLALGLGHLEDARRLFEKSLAAWRIRQVPFQSAHQQLLLGKTHLLLGDFEAGEESLRNAVREWWGAGYKLASALGLLYLGVAMRERGDERNSAMLHSALRFIHDSKARFSRTEQLFIDQVAGMMTSSELEVPHESSLESQVRQILANAVRA